jgi:hypothetical protein
MCKCTERVVCLQCHNNPFIICFALTIMPTVSLPQLLWNKQNLFTICQRSQSCTWVPSNQVRTKTIPVIICTDFLKCSSSSSFFPVLQVGLQSSQIKTETKQETRTHNGIYLKLKIINFNLVAHGEFFNYLCCQVIIKWHPCVEY